MATFRVQRRTVVWVEATVEADSKEQAREIAQPVDSEVWDTATELYDTWTVDEDTEIWVSEEED